MTAATLVALDRISMLQPCRQRLGGDADILQRRGVGQDAGDLIGSRDPLARDAVGRRPGDVLAIKQDAARRGPQNAGQAVEEGALSRAVRPDDGADFAVLDCDVDVLTHPTRL
jgi:hypothetical protein